MKEETRYIFSKGELTRKDFSIKFKNDNGNNYLPIKDTKELYCFNDISLSTKLLDILGKTGIMMHFFDYYGHYSGTFYPKEYLISGELTVKQSKTYIENRLVIAKAIVNGIAKNIYSILYHYYRHGKKELKPYLDFLKSEVPLLLKKDILIKQVLYIEGSIWAQFYDCFKYFLPEEFVMNKRVRRPPDNPINALISFGNSLLYSKTIAQIYQTHLNQAISFLHEPSEGRFSLSLDLSEVFKPILVYKTIFDCVNNRKLSVEKHFRKEYNYCILNDEGRKVFVKEFDERLNQTFEHNKLKRKCTYKKAIKIEGYKLIKFIVEGDEFIPFSLEDKK